MKTLLALFLLASPLAAQDVPSPAAPAGDQPVAAEMPEALARAKLVIRSGGLSKTYETNVAALFLNKNFRTIRMSDGSQRVFQYKPGELLGNSYMLPLEMRSNGRLYSLFKFYFTFDGGAEAYLVRWEEVNFIGRQVLRYTTYAELERGMGFFRSIQPEPEKEAPAEEPLPQENMP